MVAEVLALFGPQRVRPDMGFAHHLGDDLIQFRRFAKSRIVDGIAPENVPFSDCGRIIPGGRTVLKEIRRIGFRNP